MAVPLRIEAGELEVTTEDGRVTLKIWSQSRTIVLHQIELSPMAARKVLEALPGAIKTAAERALTDAMECLSVQEEGRHGKAG